MSLAVRGKVLSTGRPDNREVLFRCKMALIGLITAFALSFLSLVLLAAAIYERNEINMFTDGMLARLLGPLVTSVISFFITFCMDPVAQRRSADSLSGGGGLCRNRFFLHPHPGRWNAFPGGRVKWDSCESLNETHWKDEKKARIAQCTEILNQKARTPETDLRGTLDLASRALRDGTAKKKKLIIVHNGILTAGGLSFVGADLASLDENTVQDPIAQLTEKQALPDLTGFQVDWIYLVKGVEPQQSASSQSRANLQLLWQTALETCGVDTVTFIHHA